MSADANLPAIKAKLRRLVDACLEQAESNPDFAAQLEDILLSDNLKRDKPKKRPRVDVDVVSELAKAGPDGLRKRLDGLAESELRQVAKADGALNGKEVKEADRSRLIDALMAYADRKLNQGGSFLGVSKTTDTATDTSA
jgi:hypothetical protein